MRTIVGLMATGCLMPDISDTLDAGEGAAEVELGEDGVLVDATDEDAWVAFDLDTGEFVDHAAATWDVAFRRFNVDLAEGLAAAVVEDATYEDVTAVPDDGWREDLPDEDNDGVPEYALADWYDYDQDQHLLTPATRVYVVVSSEGRYHKVAFDSYYDPAGTPARISLRTTELTAP